MTNNKQKNLSHLISRHKELIEECKNQAEVLGTAYLQIGVSLGYDDGYFVPVKARSFIKFLESEVEKYKKQLDKINKQLEVENDK